MQRDSEGSTITEPGAERPSVFIVDDHLMLAEALQRALTAGGSAATWPSLARQKGWWSRLLGRRPISSSSISSWVPSTGFSWSLRWERQDACSSSRVAKTIDVWLQPSLWVPLAGSPRPDPSKS